MRYELNTELSAAAKNGFKSDGVELNPWLVQYSRVAALTNGVSKATSFYRKDLWKFDVSAYKHIVIFGVEQMVILYTGLSYVIETIFFADGRTRKEITNGNERRLTDYCLSISVAKFKSVEDYWRRC